MYIVRLLSEDLTLYLDDNWLFTTDVKKAALFQKLDGGARYAIDSVEETEGVSALLLEIVDAKDADTVFVPDEDFTETEI